jgi:hypothetical protein
MGRGRRGGGRRGGARRGIGHRGGIGGHKRHGIGMRHGGFGARKGIGARRHGGPHAHRSLFMRRRTGGGRRGVHFSHAGSGSVRGPGCGLGTLVVLAAVFGALWLFFLLNFVGAIDVFGLHGGRGGTTTGGVALPLLGPVIMFPIFFCVFGLVFCASRGALRKQAEVEAGHTADVALTLKGSGSPPEVIQQVEWWGRFSSERKCENFFLKFCF